jgi:hypothetical protein
MKKPSKPSKSTQNPEPPQEIDSPLPAPPREPPSSPPAPAARSFQPITLSDADVELLLQRL